MTRVYYILFNATIVASQDGADVIEPEQTMVVRGAAVRYVHPHGALLLCQILGEKDEILFSAPADRIKSVWSPTHPEERDDNVFELTIARDLQDV